MSSALGSVFGGNGIIGSAISSAISVAFPPAGIALSVANMVSGAVGQAVESAVSQLTKQSGMPSFLQDGIGDMIKNVLSGLQQKSDPGCDHAAQQDFGGDIQDLLSKLSQSIAEQANQNMCGDDDSQGGGGKGGKAGGGSGSSWLIALAKAMGQVAGKHADKLVELSNKMDAASSNGDSKGAGSSEFVQAQSEFQAESQMFGMLQSAFSNAIKSIGEGMSQMARKG